MSATKDGQARSSREIERLSAQLQRTSNSLAAERSLAIQDFGLRLVLHLQSAGTAGNVSCTAVPALHPSVKSHHKARPGGLSSCFPFVCFVHVLFLHMAKRPNGRLAQV